MPLEDRFGKAGLEPCPLGTLADDDASMRDPAPVEAPNNILHYIETFFSDEPANEQDYDFSISDPSRAPPLERSSGGIEQIRFNSPRPESQVPVDSMCFEYRDHRRGGDVYLPALRVEPAEVPPDPALQKAEPVVGEVGGKVRVIRCHDRLSASTSPSKGCKTKQIGCSYVKQVRVKGSKAINGVLREAEGNAIFRSSRRAY